MKKKLIIEHSKSHQIKSNKAVHQIPPPPPEIPPKDQGKRPVVEYSPVRPQQRLSVIDVNAPINATEDAVRKWVLENPHPDPAQELFRFESRVIHWSDMLLLKLNTEIPTCIIDAWAAILNHNEEDRFDAIDNSSSVPKTEDKYGDVPKKLKENKDQLNALRVKYLTALVMSNLNEHRARNIQQASEFGLEG
nr:uncharacterized protein LOC109175178 [Ipomoea trifida]